MAEITIGSLHLVSDGMKLSVMPDGQPESTVKLEPVDVGVLIDFLMSLSASEFNRRQTFRIPLWDTCGLKVQLKQGDLCVEANPQNISLTGILVETDEEPVFAGGEELIDVTLEFEGKQQTLVSRIRRRREGQLGLFFTESTLTGEADPTPECTALVMELQRRWAARRKST